MHARARICLAISVIFLTAACNPLGIDREPLVDTEAPDDTGLLEVSKIDLKAWKGVFGPGEPPDPVFGLALKHLEDRRLLFLRAKENPRYGVGPGPYVDETTATWAPTPVYRYDISLRTLEIVDERDWPSDVVAVECARQSLEMSVVRPDDGDDYMPIGAARLPHHAFAKNIVRWFPSPSKRFAGVVSAAGKHRWVHMGSFLPTGSRKSADADGQHYHQTIRLPEGTYTGPVLKLPPSAATDEFYTSSCWTPSEDYVIYYDGMRGEWFSIVPTGAVEGNGR